MNRNGVIALTVAVVIGLVGVYLLNIMLSGLENRRAAEDRAAQMTQVVVAAKPIAFGATINELNAKIVSWPKGVVPKGAFHSFQELGGRRVALQSIVEGEPLLASRVSGKSGRATLSVNLQPDKLAVSVPINDVTGVSGFVRPGDAVDVLLTRQIPGDNASGSDRMTDVVMQAVRVLAIDQVADPGKTDPSIPKTATLEVDQNGAQRLTLARELGSLSLALRNVASQPGEQPNTVTPRDFMSKFARLDAPVQRAVAAPPPAPSVRPPLSKLPPPKPKGPTMTIYRKATPTDYEVKNAF